MKIRSSSRVSLCTNAIRKVNLVAMKTFPWMWPFHIILSVLMAFILYSAFSVAPADPAAIALAKDIVETTAKTWQMDAIIRNAAPQNVLDTQKINSQFTNLSQNLGAFQRIVSFQSRAGNVMPVADKSAPPDKTAKRTGATFKATVLYEHGGTEISLTMVQMPDNNWKLVYYEITEAKFAEAPAATNQPPKP